MKKNCAIKQLPASTKDHWVRNFNEMQYKINCWHNNQNKNTENFQIKCLLKQRAQSYIMNQLLEGYNSVLAENQSILLEVMIFQQLLS